MNLAPQSRSEMVKLFIINELALILFCGSIKASNTHMVKPQKTNNQYPKLDDNHQNLILNALQYVLMKTELVPKMKAF